MINLQTATHYLIVFAVICFAIMVFLCFIRAVKGTSIADRIVAINMIGTMVIIIICLLAIDLKESYLVDISLVYAMISFLAVIVLCKVFTGVYYEKQKEKMQVTKKGEEEC